MLLSTLKVQHYKSLGNVTVDFDSDVTVVVGPNGVGKSNFVDALRFLHDSVTSDLEHAVTKREGVQRLLQSYKTKPYKMQFQCDFKERNEPDTASYSLQIKSVGTSGYRVESETCNLSVDSLGIGFIDLELEWNRDAKGRISTTISNIDSSGLNSEETTHLNAGYSGDALALAANAPAFDKKNPMYAYVGKAISEWNYCTIYPNTLKKPAFPDRDSKLMESGENWASVIKAHKRSPKGREALERVYEAMRAVLPTFSEVTVQTVGSYLVPVFKFDVHDDPKAATFDPVQLSDGTLRLFGILLAAYQLPRPKLLVIEEPEQTIFPGALAVLADVFKEIGRTTQVLVTTHSPHFVQFFEPSQIRVAVMRNGTTKIRPIHPHQVEAVSEGLLSLEEFMTTEGLRPDDRE